MLRDERGHSYEQNKSMVSLFITLKDQNNSVITIHYLLSSSTKAPGIFTSPAVAAPHSAFSGTSAAFGIGLEKFDGVLFGIAGFASVLCACCAFLNSAISGLCTCWRSFVPADPERGRYAGLRTTLMDCCTAISGSEAYRTVDKFEGVPDNLAVARL